MSVVKAATILCLTTLFACSTSEAPPASPTVKSKETNSSTGLSDAESGNDPFGDIFGTMGTGNSAASIRSAKKSQLMQEVGMLENDLSTAMSNMNQLKSQITGSVLTKGLPSANSPTVQGSLLTAGGSFITAGAVGAFGLGSAGSSGSGSSGSTGSSSSSGIGGSLTSPLTGGFNALGDAVSIGITKDENGKTIKKITGSIQEQIAQYDAEVQNLQAQIDQKNAEINQLILLGTR
jgi:hypothetical protein